jgi:hypothetical protein
VTLGQAQEMFLCSTVTAFPCSLSVVSLSPVSLVFRRVLQSLGGGAPTACLGGGMCDGPCNGIFGVFGQYSHRSSPGLLHWALGFRCFETSTPISLSSSVVPSHKIDYKKIDVSMPKYRSRPWFLNFYG